MIVTKEEAKTKWCPYLGKCITDKCMMWKWELLFDDKAYEEMQKENPNCSLEYSQFYKESIETGSCGLSK